MNKLIRRLLQRMLIMLANKIGEPVVKASARPDLRRAQPGIYKDLDEMMPELLQEAGPRAMTRAIVSIAENRLARSVDNEDLKVIIRDYNPVRAVAERFMDDVLAQR